MGCGTGRVLLPTARAGAPITGMDISSGMLEVLRRSLSAEREDVRARVTVLEGDVRCSDAGGRFPLITAPFRVAHHLLNRADQRAWLQNVKRHLLAGGRLCFDVFQVDPLILAAEGNTRAVIDRVEPGTGHRVRRFDTVRSLTALQLIDIRVEWVKENQAGERLSSTNAQCLLRWYTRAELENLLELEGFEITDYWGSFGRDDFGCGSEQQIVRARLAS
jgi:SAM-dependent methyltransferase